MSVPLIAAVTGVALGIYVLSRQLSPTESGTETQAKYHPPLYQIQVDNPLNTLSRDDRAPAGATLDSALKNAFYHSKEVYAAEARAHPGVRMVAHTVL